MTKESDFSAQLYAKSYIQNIISNIFSSLILNHKIVVKQLISMFGKVQTNAYA